MRFPEKIRQILESGQLDIASRSAEADQKRIHLPIVFADLAQLVGGALIVALAINLFIAPHNIAPGGSSGLGIIITSFIDLPLGLTLLAFNIPAFFLGYKKLGGTSFLVRSVIATVTYNLSLDLMSPFLPAGGLTNQMILNAIFGGVLGGIGVGLIYRAGGTAGAGGVVTRVLHRRWGWPIRFTKLFTNSFIIALAAFVFGWEAAMYALISFFVSGATADFVLEGPDVVQTALIITDYPDRVAHALMDRLHHGVTRWAVQSGTAEKDHTALYCTVERPQINALKNIVAAADDEAFVIITQGHEALGKGFRPVEWAPPAVENIQQNNP